VQVAAEVALEPQEEQRQRHLLGALGALALMLTAHGRQQRGQVLLVSMLVAVAVAVLLVRLQLPVLAGRGVAVRVAPLEPQMLEPPALPILAAALVVAPALEQTQLLALTAALASSSSATQAHSAELAGLL
jgi:hypothetical protein